MAERIELEGMDTGVVALDVTLEDYLEFYAAHHCEWVEGVVIKVSPSKLQHVMLIQYFILLFNMYFEYKPMGRIIVQPFVIRLPEFPRRRREPDLFIVLNTNPNELKDSYMDGAPDICIEIVSEDSVARDYGDKLYEYQTGGVPEYWIFDPLKSQSRFYRLGEDGRYERVFEDEQGNYHSALLPNLLIHVPTLWQDELPKPSAVLRAVRAMLGQNDSL